MCAISESISFQFPPLPMCVGADGMMDGVGMGCVEIGRLRIIEDCLCFRPG